MAKVKFPSVGRVTKEKPYIFYERARIVKLYNQHHLSGSAQKNLAKNVRQWFENEARARGWHLKLMTEYGISKGAGYIMWSPAKRRVTKITAQMLVIDEF